MNNRNLISRKNLFALFLGFMFASASTTALAALDAYATIEGETQGVIAGDVDIDPHVGSILVKSFGSSVSADFDMETGLPTGGEQHRPIRIFKNVDTASPKLLQALVDNETLLNVTIKFYRPSGTGAEQHYYTVQLLNAHVVSILPSHSSRVDDQQLQMNETVSLTYGKMIVTWEDGGITGEVNW